MAISPLLQIAKDLQTGGLPTLRVPGKVINAPVVLVARVAAQRKIDSKPEEI